MFLRQSPQLQVPELTLKTGRRIDLRVLRVCPRSSDNGLTLARRTVRAEPPRESFNSRVRIESRYGMKACFSRIASRTLCSW